MTEPRPEPVLDAAKLGGLVAAAVVAVLGVVLTVAAGITLDNLTALGVVIAGAVTAVAALGAYLAQVWQGRKARAQVTPLDDPRDEAGRELVPAGVSDSEHLADGVDDLTVDDILARDRTEADAQADRYDRPADGG